MAGVDVAVLFRSCLSSTTPNLSCLQPDSPCGFTSALPSEPLPKKSSQLTTSWEVPSSPQLTDSPPKSKKRRSSPERKALQCEYSRRSRQKKLERIKVLESRVAELEKQAKLKDVAYEQLTDQHAQLKAAYSRLESKYNSIQSAPSVACQNLVGATEQSAQSIQEISSILTPRTEAISSSCLHLVDESLSFQFTDNLSQPSVASPDLAANNSFLPSSPSLFKSPSLASSIHEAEDSGGLILTGDDVACSVGDALLQGNFCDSAVIVSSPQPMLPCNSRLPTLELSSLLALILASVICLSSLSHSSLHTLSVSPLTSLVSSSDLFLGHLLQKSATMPCDPG